MGNPKNLEAAQVAAAKFIGSEVYRGSSYGPWHPLRIPRVSTVIDLARALGWLPGEAYVTSPMAKPAALWSYHTRRYVAALTEAEQRQEVPEAVRARHALGVPSNPVFSEMYRRPATAVGGSLLAGELLRDGGIVHSPGGGTHHGMPDRANGFCYLNDPVFAIQSLRRNGAARVAYVDIDAHHPDGVEHGFASDTDVLMISVHEENRWPRTGALEDRGAGAVWNLPVPRGLHDDDMALIRDGLILRLLSDFAPDAIVLQCGSDAVLEDPQSRLALSNRAHLEIVRALMGMAPRLLVLGGGGYNPWSVARCWTAVWGALSGQDLPEGALPETARAVLGGLVWQGQRRVIAPEPSWLTTLVDTPRCGPVSEEVRARLRTLSKRAAVWV